MGFQRPSPRPLAGGQTNAAASQLQEQRSKPIPVLRFPEASFDRLPRTLTLVRRSRAAVLSSVALVAGGDKVCFPVSAPSREGLNVVNDRAHVIEKRRSVAPPVR